MSTPASVVRWPVPVALAVPALLAALVIAFTPGHSALFGYLVFGGFALLTAVGSGIGAALLPAGPARSGAVVKTIGTAVGAVVAVTLAIVAPTAAAPSGSHSAAAGATLGLSLTIAAVFIVLAISDLAVGLKMRGRDRYARDWITAGIIQAATAIAVVAVPPTFYQGFSFLDDGGQLVSGAVTASTMIVGLLGAAAAIVGIFQAIAGIGLLPKRERATA